MSTAPAPALQRDPDKGDLKSPAEATDPIDEESFPEYAWHLVATTSSNRGAPGKDLIRAIVAENTEIDRDLLEASTAKFTYRNKVLGGMIRPSYFSFQHPTKGIVVRAFAELEGYHPEKKPDAKLLLTESYSYKIYVFTPHPAKDPATMLSYATVFSSSSTIRLRPQVATLDLTKVDVRGEKHGSKTLTNGTMSWLLVLTEKGLHPGDEDDYAGDASALMQVVFTSNPSLGAMTVTFVQTKLQTKGSSTASKKPKIDILRGEFEPFYGAAWEHTNKQWAPEGVKDDAPPGAQNAPSSSPRHAAHLYDAPSVPTGQTKMFESVAVVLETGQTLGTLRWGVGEGKLLGAEAKDCTDAPSADFGAALDRFYATPAKLGPDPEREERYDAILDGFIANDATLTAGHEKQLDPIATKVKGEPKLEVLLGGFGDAMDKDPSGISEQRVRAVANYLISKGVPKENLVVAGFFVAAWGRYRPSMKEGRNRRVQIRLGYK